MPMASLLSHGARRDFDICQESAKPLLDTSRQNHCETSRAASPCFCFAIHCDCEETALAFRSTDSTRSRWVQLRTAGSDTGPLSRQAATAGLQTSYCHRSAAQFGVTAAEPRPSKTGTSHGTCSSARAGSKRTESCSKPCIWLDSPNRRLVSLFEGGGGGRGRHARCGRHEFHWP